MNPLTISIYSILWLIVCWFFSWFFFYCLNRQWFIFGFFSLLFLMFGAIHVVGYLLLLNRYTVR